MLENYIESPRIRYIIKRVLKSIPVVLLATMVVFSILHFAPGNPAKIILGPKATPGAIAQMEQELGLNQPIYIQYIDWISGIVQGDWGTSIRWDMPVLDLIIDRLPATLILMTSSMALSVVMGVSLGVLGALKRNSIFDYASTVMALFWRSFPSFWLGILFLYLFGLRLGWFPLGRFEGPMYLVLPMLVLGLRLQAIIARLTRSSMLDVMNKDYIKSARAKGLGERTVIIKHALRNALIPVITIIALRIPWLFSGAMVTEQVFSWPGMGRLIVSGVRMRDFPVVQGVVLLMSVSVIVGNLIADILYTFVDPRIDLAKKEVKQ